MMIAVLPMRAHLYIPRKCFLARISINFSVAANLELHDSIDHATPTSHSTNDELTVATVPSTTEIQAFNTVIISRVQV